MKTRMFQFTKGLVSFIFPSIGTKRKLNTNTRATWVCRRRAAPTVLGILVAIGSGGRPILRWSNCCSLVQSTAYQICSRVYVIRGVGVGGLGRGHLLQKQFTTPVGAGKKI